LADEAVRNLALERLVRHHLGHAWASLGSAATPT
jgi:hypothetical protein